MPDIFARQGDGFGGAMSADASQLTFTGGAAGMLVQNVNLTYRQQIQRIWEIGSKKTYYVAGRSAGTMGMARIVGPTPLSNAFFARFGDVCNAADNVMRLGGGVGCGVNQTSTYNLITSNVVIESASWAITMADMILHQNLAAVFTSLRTTEQAA